MREEYPRPEFVREEWMNLNGCWSFAYGNENTEIQVPFVCQSRLSGIGKRITEDHVVYERSFKVPEKWRDREILLHLLHIVSPISFYVLPVLSANVLLPALVYHTFHNNLSTISSS